MTQKFIDTTLTVDNCEEKGYEYIMDILYDPTNDTNTDERRALEQELSTGNSMLGQPSHTHPENPNSRHMYGFYDRVTEETKILRSIIPDHTLTPSNSKLRGYELVDEVTFDPEMGVEMNEEVIRYAKKGYILGLPFDDVGVEHYYGLYKPVTKN